jgi:hypothetical protein
VELIVILCGMVNLIHVSQHLWVEEVRRYTVFFNIIIGVAVKGVRHKGINVIITFKMGFEDIV